MPANNGAPGEEENDSQSFTKTWIIEWTSGLTKSSHEEKNDYVKAVELFNEKSQGVGDAVLYELQKSGSDGSILKKIPILNSKKAKKRKEDSVRKIRDQSEKEKDPKPTRLTKLTSMKLRLIILASVIGALIIILLLINNLSNNGNMISHQIGFIPYDISSTQSSQIVSLDKL